MPISTPKRSSTRSSVWPNSAVIHSATALLSSNLQLAFRALQTQFAKKKKLHETHGQRGSYRASPEEDLTALVQRCFSSLARSDS